MLVPAGPADTLGPGPEDELVPAGFGLRPDPGSRLLAGGTVLVGGAPVRVLRLTPPGARHVAGWWSGTPVPFRARQAELARCLAGLVQMPRVIVVDDASGDPAAVARVAADAGARVLHRA